MPHVIGENRNQFFMLSLDEAVPKDSFVRAIDTFVDAIDLESFGFTHVSVTMKAGRLITLPF